MYFEGYIVNNINVFIDLSQWSNILFILQTIIGLISVLVNIAIIKVVHIAKEEIDEEVTPQTNLIVFLYFYLNLYISLNFLLISVTNLIN